MFSIVLFLVVLIIMFVSIFMLFRNNWVYRQRMAAIYQSLDEYDKLTSYDDMLWRWWIWDIEKFKNGE